MSPAARPPDREILRSVYRHLDRKAVLAEHPGMSEADLEGFFRRLSLCLPKVDGKREASRPAKGAAAGGRLVLHVDGASRGNPGPAAYGVVVQDESGRIVAEAAKAIGRATNNEAEYHGLIRGLELAREHGAREVAVRADSQLMVRQINGRYRVKSARLRPLHLRAMRLLNTFSRREVEHIPRESNARADALANGALDREEA